MRRSLLLSTLLITLIGITIFTSCDEENDAMPKKTVWYQDNDGDGRGNPDVYVYSDIGPSGWINDGSDHDDNLPCDPGITFYRDRDGDGLGDPNDKIIACTAPEGYVDNGIDDADVVNIDYFVNTGGTETGNFSADEFYSGGKTYGKNAVIDTSAIAANPAPSEIFKTERYGNVTYTFSGLNPGSERTVTLYFAELYWGEAGKRVFNVSINGLEVLTNFDIYATAGATYKAIAQTFTATVASTGQVVIEFVTVADNAKVSGISVKVP